MQAALDARPSTRTFAISSERCRPPISRGAHRGSKASSQRLGIDVSATTVGKYMIRHRKAPSPTWRTFLDNHVKDTVAVDFFVVPTATFEVLFVFLMLAHDRGRILHFNVTRNPTPEWTSCQIVQSFPEDTAPRYLLRDRDGAYGRMFSHRMKSTRSSPAHDRPGRTFIMPTSGWPLDARR